MTATDAASPGRRRSIRDRARSTRAGRILWRLGATVLGVLITAVGVILLPLPGPGWLIIFAGLSVLATEYAWAARLLSGARRFAHRWATWFARRPLGLRIFLVLLGIATFAAAVYAVYFYER